MMNQDQRNAFNSYFAKEVTFDEFARKTRAFWEASAAYLLKRWQCPDAVEVADIHQELLRAAWLAFPKADPTRGEVCVYVAREAMSQAARWMHQQRGNRKCSRSAKKAARHDLSFATFRKVVEDGEVQEPFDFIPAEGQTPEEMLLRDQEATKRMTGVDHPVSEENGDLVLAILARKKGDIEAAIHEASSNCLVQLLLGGSAERALRKEMAHAIKEEKRWLRTRPMYLITTTAER